MATGGIKGQPELHERWPYLYNTLNSHAAFQSGTGAMKQQQEGLVKHTLERGPRLLRYSDLSSGIMKIQVSKFRTQFQKSKDFYICQLVVSFFL